MKLHEINKQPTTTSELCRLPNDPDPKIHESVFRSYQILEKVKELMDLGTPSAVVRELIDEMERPLPGGVPGIDVSSL